MAHRTLLLLLLLLTPGWAWAQSVFVPQAVLVGAGNQTSQLTVLRAEDGSQGELESLQAATPYLAVLFTPAMLGDAFAWGFALEAHEFATARQVVDGQRVNVGTTARGWTARLRAEVSFITAAGFDDGFFQAGVGAGFAYLSARGEVVLNDADGTRLPFDVTESGALDGAAFLRIRGGNLFVGVSSGGPLAESGGIELQTAFTALVFGFAF